MSQTPFDGLTPTRVLWVSTTGSSAGTGSSASPFNSVQAAVDAATPGTAIKVEPGTYVENVQITSAHSGTSSAPIWIESAGAPQSAHIVAADPTLPVIGGGGVTDIVVSGLWLSGGENGAQFSQNGFDFTKPVQNIVVQGNRVDGSAQDGIKVDGGDHVYVLDNIIHGGGQQGVDFVAINDSVILSNDISGITGSDGLFVKGGSTNITIAGNYLHGLAWDGIGVGNHMSTLQDFRPGYDTYEAKNVLVIGNNVEGNGGRALVFQGAVYSKAIDNHLGASLNGYYTAAINSDTLDTGQVFNSSYITILSNAFDSPHRMLGVQPGQSTGLVFHANTTNGLQTVGDASPNVIVGSTGADIIWGGGGADTLTGGGGSDTFIYANANEGGDRITDFQIGVDRIDLRPLAAVFHDLSVTFQDTVDGLTVTANYAGTHELLATLEGVHAASLAQGTDYLI